MRNTEKMQILIVDDVEINREIFADLLADQYSPLQAANGLEAIDLIHQYSDKIALILLDIVMPELDGYGVLQEMQAMDLIGVIPVIIISAMEGQEAIDRAYELGATDFLTRNADSATLNKRIFNYIQLFGRQKTSLHEISTQAELLATQNRRLETLDELTGCNNLASFRKEVEAILQANPHQSFALWYTDIKQFKLVNNRFGYDVGDYVLKYCSKRIQLALQPGETYGRLSGDRFVILTHYDGTDFLASRFWNMVGSVQSCLSRINLDFDLEISAGAYLIHADSSEQLSINLMLDRAILATESVKHKNGSHFCLYTSEMLEKELRRAQISKHLNEALQNGEVMAYFQPQFDFSVQAVSGAETLCRWKHNTLGWLSPAEFIPVLEKSNQIYLLDQFIWRQACRAIRELRNKGILTPISVNVSRADIQEETLIESLQSCLREFDLTPRDLHLEVTESAYIEDSNQLKQVVHSLQAMGFLIEMDDFGSGYSSLNTLKDLPVNMLKLDAYFIRQAVSDPRGSVILDTVIGMAHRLRLPLIAEGIETLDQARDLLAMGCRLMQGYYFARPMPMEDFLRLMDATPNTGAHQLLPAGPADDSGRGDPQESAALLKQIIDFNSCGIFAYTLPDHRVLQANREAYRLMGVEESQIRPGLNPYPRLEELMVPQDRVAVGQAGKNIDQSGAQMNVTYRLQKNGKVFCKVNLVAKHLQMPSGEEMIVSTLVDITEKSRIEEALNASIQAYHIASMEMGDSVFIFNAETRTVHVENKEMCIFSEGSIIENVPESTVDNGTVAPESRQDYLDLYNQILNGATSASAVIHRFRITGEPMVAQMRLRAVLDGEGATTGRVVGVITDITTEYEQHRTLEDISVAQEQTQQVIKLHEDVIHALSADYFAIYLVDMQTSSMETIRANDRMLLQRLEPMGKTVSIDSRISLYPEKVIHPEDLETVSKEMELDNIQSRLQTEGVFFVRFRRMNGSGAEYMELKIADVSEKRDGRRAVLALRNIDSTVRRDMQYQERLRTALANAEYSSQSKTRFLSNMSHDIRTPMNAIMGFASIAASHLDDSEQVKDCIDKIQSASSHLQNLINDILDMSKIESGAMTIREEKVSLSNMIQSLIAITLPQIQVKDQHFYPALHNLVHESVLVDSLKLNQVLLNILGNAVKFTPDGGSIWFSVTQSPSHQAGRAKYTFVIRDTGIGMSKDFVSHIYEPFERENTSTVSRTEGTGLGMTIAKRIVDAMDGQIQVQSQPGQGTTVTLVVELRMAENHDQWLKALPLVGRRVCLIGSDPDQLANVKATLAALSVDVVPQGQPADAAILIPGGQEKVSDLLPLARASSDAIILCDLLRPKELHSGDVQVFCQQPIFLSKLRDALLEAMKLPEETTGAAEDTQIPPGTRILLVEDNPLNMEIACSILEEVGLRVDTAANGQEALRMAEQSSQGYYKLILMDIQMPVMNGYQASKAIRALDRPDLKAVPIIALTADAFREDQERAKQCGMNDHLSKPIQVELLLSKLRDWL